MDRILFKTLLLKGEAGNSILSIEKTATVGLVDTYTVTLTDGSTSTFEVTNGSDIDTIEKTATSGLVDTYTITLTDGSTSTFSVTNGDYIVSIAKTATVGLVDTYTITMASGATYTFDVTNSSGGTWTSAVSCVIGDTTATFVNADIATTSTIDYYTQNTSGTPVGINSVTVTNGQAVLAFDALEEATDFKLHIMNV